MTERERQQAIDILQAGGHLACAGLIEKFVWANTSKPRFPYGAPVQIRTQLEIERTVSDKELGQAIEVAREETVVGKITRLERRINDRTYFYEITFEVDKEDGTVHEYKDYRFENAIYSAREYEVNKFSNFAHIERLLPY